MVDVIWAPAEKPAERHVVVQAHRDVATPSHAKGYFFDSAEGDNGGSGPFDWRLNEAIDRAKQFAAERGIRTIIVVGKAGR